jgi:alpha-maltose-1-phosphate synthase
MKVLLLYDYPPPPGGLATQGDLLYRGLLESGVDAHAVHLESTLEKQWYYDWFAPDVVLGIGYWGHTPHIVLHPQRFGRLAVPWLVADGYIANYLDVLNALPLILVTSSWVKEVYGRDGVSLEKIEVLPVGCDTDAFLPRARSDPKVRAVREGLGVSEDELLILTVGGDAASKGGQEVIEALALIQAEAPAYKYVCKVWPQPRTTAQNALDVALATRLGIEHNVIHSTSKTSREFMPFLLAACDIYAGPSRLEGFGMVQVEANACGKPVVAIDAMAFRDTMVQGETALLAGIAQEIKISSAVLGEAQGFPANHRVEFPYQRTSDYRASVPDLAAHLLRLMNSPTERERLGSAGRKRAVALYDYRVVAQRFVQLMTEKLGLG